MMCCKKAVVNVIVASSLLAAGVYDKSACAETVLSQTIRLSGGVRLEVDVSNETMNPTYPFDRTALWGGSKEFPASSFIKRVLITLGQEAVLLPLSCYTDLTASTGVKAKEVRGGFEVYLHGADGGNAWGATLTFQGNRLKERIVFSSEFPEYRETTKFPNPNSAN